MRDINDLSMGNALAPSGATQYHAQLGLPDKGNAIKGLVVCNSWDLEPLDRTWALGCYHPSPEVWLHLYLFVWIEWTSNESSSRPFLQLG